MESYLPFECAGCGQPSDDFYCYSCKCQECGCHLINGICRICTYDGENPIDFSTPYSFNESPNFSYHPTHSQPILCEFSGIDARYGHYCTPQVPIISNLEPCYNQDYDEFPQTLPSFPQQYPCCENCGGLHEAFQCQPLNYYEPNPCYDSNYSDYEQFDNFHPQQFPCCENCGGPHETYQCQPINEDYYHEQNSCYDPNSFGFDQFQPPQYTVNHPILNAQNDLLNSQNKLLDQITFIPVCYDDDDNKESSIPLKDTIISGLPPCVAITPALSTEEPVDSLIMEDEHLDTILATESGGFIKSSVENLVQNPSESEDFFDIESDDDESFSDVDVPNKIYSNPLFDEEIIFVKIDASIISMIDSLVKQFSGELAHNDLIPPGINETDFDLEEDIHFIERLLYDNLFPQPPEAFQANSNTIIDSFPTFHIPVEDSDSLREEIDILHRSDDSIPPGIESDDFDSEDDDNSTFLPEFKSFHVDYPDSRDSTIDVVEDIPMDVPNILPTHPALQLDFDFIPSHNDLGFDLDNSSPSGDRNKNLLSGDMY
ncbi:hypothetical protein Tco_1315094 [Tanacetum coccineum]